MSQQDERMPEPQQELVAFRVADQEYCVDIMAVREIRGWTPATVLPHAPEYVMGVINLRGSVVPIVNLAARLNLPTPKLSGRNVIVIVVVGGQTVGLLVDAVSDILGVPVNSIQPTPPVASDRARGFLQGVRALGDRMLRLLDLEAVLPPRQERARLP
ncbi:MAG: chemotaxis protein CheW [Pseudorhodobacter sp.]|nr:chemotaxis protein CheW [Pseudorhodobacter sp.]